LLELVPAESQGEWRHVIDDAPASSPQTTPASDRADCGEVAARAETLLLHRDGTRIPVELIARPGEDGEPLRLLVVRDIRDRHAAQARMHYLAHHDPLTGLPNRLAFMSQLEHLMVAAQASSTQLGLLFIDLDHFQRVNESAGHRAGDIQLKAIARRIGEQVRSTDRVARFGGDEFMVLLPGLRDVQDALQVAHKLIAAIAAPIEIEGRSISVTATRPTCSTNMPTRPCTQPSRAAGRRWRNSSQPRPRRPTPTWCWKASSAMPSSAASSSCCSSRRSAPTTGCWPGSKR
jgi:diguanylate cyclase (GGDEF)-like protein